MRAFLLLLCLWALPAAAQPVPYDLDRENSLVAFRFDLAGDTVKGNMPVASANILLDTENLPATSGTVTLSPGDAVTEIGFATDAMLGANVLNTEQFPEIKFQTTAVRGTFSKGEVDGLLTVRGVTRPVTMDAQVFRQRGTDSGDLSRLSILFTGTINRDDFGASGFPQFVGPEIEIEVLTRLTRR
ncbi:MAG: YceI family protein [Pseudomonadota bacterium]